MTKRVARGVVRGEKGFSLIEVVISIALLAIIGVAFLSALTSSTNGVRILNERETAKNLAEFQLEYVKSLPFSASSSGYTAATPPSEYTGFSVQNNSITAESARDGEEDGENLQKLSVTILHNGREIITVEGYKECPRTEEGT